MSNTATLPEQAYLMPTYARQPIRFVRGVGSYLYDKNNTAYLDALTGIAVCGLGHCHPNVTQAISEQAATLVHTSNLFEVPWQEHAGALLCQAANMEKVFFCNSGAEANEAALKLARRFAANKGMQQPKVIVMHKSFHGRTLLTLSATGNDKVKTGFYPLTQDFIHVPFGDINAIEAVATEYNEICAVLCEPIQGEGGVNTAANGFNFLDDVRALCDKHDWLMMLDEVQTGNGRTGQYFAYQHTTCQPDVVTTAKGLGNGFPVGACMVAGKAANLFAAGAHGSTFGGTPLASRVICSVYQTLTTENILQNATDMGNYLHEQLTTTLKHKGLFVRGAGVMLGVVLPEDSKQDYSQLIHKARDNHQLIINVTGGNVVRLLPALNLNQADADILLEKLTDLLSF